MTIIKNIYHHLSLNTALIFVLLLGNLFLTGHAQTSFQKTYGVASQHFDAQSIDRTADKGFILVGTIDNSDMYMIKLDSCSTTEWAYTYGGASADRGFAVIETMDGGFALLGESSSFSGTIDALLVKTDATGNVEWSQTFGGSDTDEALDLIQTADSGFAITGIVTGATGGRIMAAKTDKNGNIIWLIDIADVATITASEIAGSCDGGYVIAGNSTAVNPNNDIMLTKIDGNGNLMWTKVYAGSSTESGKSIDETNDNGYVVSGSKSPILGIKSDVFVMRLNSSGDTLWTKEYETSGTDAGTTVEQTPDGGFIVGGQCEGANPTLSQYQKFMLKLDSDGNKEWDQYYGGNREDFATQVVQAFDKSYLLVGKSRSWDLSFYQMYLVRADSNGNSGCNQPAGSLTLSKSDLNITTPTYTATSYGSGQAVAVTRSVFVFNESLKCIYCQDAPILFTDITGGNSNVSMSVSGDSSICPGETAVLTASGMPGYLWSTGETTTSINVSPVTSSCYPVMGTSACDTTYDTLCVLVNSFPVFDLGDDTTIGSWGNVQLYGASGITYIWSPTSGLSCLNCTDPIATPGQTTMYLLTVQDSNGCSYSDSITIIIDDTYELFIPNIFSPDKDGINDDFRVYGFGINTFSLSVYNRWGESVFESNNISLIWDGTNNGRELNSGVYRYVLVAESYSGESISSKGNITLLK